MITNTNPLLSLCVYLDPKVSKPTVVWATFRGFGLLFYILLGSRQRIPCSLYSV